MGVCLQKQRYGQSESRMEMMQAVKKNAHIVGLESNQFAKEVTDFSSQYGSDTSISYSICNLASAPSVYPEYGDFTQAAVLRTYGKWWKESPSSKRSTKHFKPPSFLSEDFIEVMFETAVYPSSVRIYETYNPGAVVRILACNQEVISQDSASSTHVKTRWFVLWEGSQEKAPAKPRIFSPQPLIPCPFATNIIRIELNSDSLDYYTELDAIELCGHPSQLACNSYSNHSMNGPTTDTAEVKPDDLSVDVGGGDASVTRTEAITKELVSLHLQDHDGLSAALAKSDNGLFDQLPEEVIQAVISYLDVPSLCRLALVSHLFYQHCYDSLQYSHLNLQPYWHLVDNATLDGLTSRCKLTHHLNLSWCGAAHAVTGHAFTRFMQNCCKELVSLKLANCNFVDNNAMKTVCQQCLNLRELDIQGCRHIDNFGFVNIARLQQLQILNLYRTMVDIHSLTAIIRSCAEMEVLNLGSCTSVNNYNDIAVELATHCKKLKCLDLWRARSLSEIGLSVLAQYCPLLEELDLGWCSLLMSSTGCFEELFKKCQNMKKIFLTANRTVCDRDLEAIVRYCPLLEQLDVLGTREISQATTQKVLEHCKHLRFLDISFCNNIDFVTARQWQEQYPLVSIKKSFQSTPTY